jgi:hypothetical protein
MKLIKQTATQRYYQLDFKIKVYGKNQLIKDLDLNAIEFYPDYELAEDLSESINKVCVSDANTHIERLVFVAFSVRNKTTGEITFAHRCDRIDGKWTFKICGGDPDSVYDDRVYIRHLRQQQNGA